MRHSPDIILDPNAYNDDGLLRAPMPLVLVMVYQARYLLILPLAALTDFLGRGPMGAALGAGDPVLPPWVLLPASLPALAVIAAWARRQPKAGRMVRWLWRRGRGLLVAGAALDLALMVPVAVGGGLPVTAVILMALAGFYSLLYLIRSRRLPAVFADFPEPDGKR